MATTQSKNAGGYLWAVLMPVGSIAVFSLVLSVGLKIRTPSLGSNFPIFFATGMLPFTLYNELGNKIAKALKFSRQLLQYPSVCFTDAILARLIMTLVTFAMVFYVVMTGIHLIWNTSNIVDYNAIIVSISMTAVLGVGVGCLNCYLMSTFQLWSNIWGILTTPMFLLSTIIYTFEEVPRGFQDVLWYNPLIHCIGLMRRAFYPTYDAVYVSPAYVFGFGLICLAIGLLFLNLFHREIINGD